MTYIEKLVKDIKGVNNDEEIKNLLLALYIESQMDSNVRKELDKEVNKSLGR
jgi:hypothetical protein